MNAMRKMDGGGNTESERVSINICHLSQDLGARKSWASIIPCMGKSMHKHPEARRGMGYPRYRTTMCFPLYFKNK